MRREHDESLRCFVIVPQHLAGLELDSDILPDARRSAVPTRTVTVKSRMRLIRRSKEAFRRVVFPRIDLAVEKSVIAENLSMRSKLNDTEVRLIELPSGQQGRIYPPLILSDEDKEQLRSGMRPPWAGRRKQI